MECKVPAMRMVYFETFQSLTTAVICIRRRKVICFGNFNSQWKNNFLGSFRVRIFIYVVGSKSFRSDTQKPRQMENAVRDI